MNDTPEDDKWIVDTDLAEVPATRGDLFRVANRSLMLSARIYQGMIALRDQDKGATDDTFDEIMKALQENARLVDELVGSYQRGE